MIPRCEYRLGRWQDVMGDISVVLEEARAITPGAGLTFLMDPPYSARTHAGQRTGSSGDKSTINYAPLTLGHVHHCVEFMARHSPRWVVVFGDDETSLWWKQTLEEAGLYVVRPGAYWVKPDAAPRKSGDGPMSSVEPLAVARAKGKGAMSGSLPGYYLVGTAGTRDDPDSIPGEKPVGVIQALVRDYSREGDLVVDLFGGRATTNVACRSMNRPSLSCEMNPVTHAQGEKRLLGWVQQRLFAQETAHV